VAACTAIGATTKLTLHSVIPTIAWLLCIGVLMPGKRSWVNAVTGSMTPDQLRRQARDRPFLPQPPPPPLPEAPRRSAWEDMGDTRDCATQCDPAFTAEQADPPLSGKFLDTINRALAIIELQYRPGLPCPGAGAPQLEAQPKQPVRQLLLETLIVDTGCTHVSPPLDDAPITLSEITCMPPAPLLVDAPMALKEVSYFDDFLPDAATTEVATGNFYIGEPPMVPEDANTADIAALEERIAKLEDTVYRIGIDHDLIIEGAIQIENRVAALELAGVGGHGAASLVTMDEEPFTAAQYEDLNRIFNSSIMHTLDTFTDLIIGKVHSLIANEMQTSFNPVCGDFRNQLESLQREVLTLQIEYISNLDPMQIRMKKYSFKRRDDSDRMHEPDVPNLVHDSHVDNNLMQVDHLHVEDGPNLVRYFEKLVRDEVSSCSSANDSQASDSNLMHSDQIDTGETLQDCIDFDELMNDFHSTAASAQLLQQTLSGSLGPTLSGGDDGPNILALVPDT